MIYILSALPYVLCSILVGIWAHNKGHTGIGAFIGALGFSPVVMAIVVAIVKDLRLEKKFQSLEAKVARMIRSATRNTAQEQAPTVLCAACGANNWLGQPVCHACGTALPVPQPAPRVQRAPQHRRTR